MNAMNIKQLIDELTQIWERHGNLPVYWHTCPNPKRTAFPKRALASISVEYTSKCYGGPFRYAIHPVKAEHVGLRGN